jgi:hypothetical protein
MRWAALSRMNEFWGSVSALLRLLPLLPLLLPPLPQLPLLPLPPRSWGGDS